MKRMKNNLDERQELELLRIEHNGCWIAFWGLLIVMLVQMIAGNDGPKNLAGEWVVFMFLAIYIVVGCIKNGIWDRKLKPDFKTNIIVSSIASVVMGIVWFTISYRNYHRFAGSVATGIFIFLVTEIVCFAALVASSKIYKKRLQQLEEMDEDSVDDK